MPDPAGVAGGARQPRVEQPLSTSAPGADLPPGERHEQQHGREVQPRQPIRADHLAIHRQHQAEDTTAEQQRPDQI